ncbi:MAG TPA: GAF domain-containing protein, partial [Terriglobales bacterium]|nr:GAF domain-containing protein [Terriglobales bacterium]
MSARSTLDPESFQKILASAFAVQECLADTQALSAIVQVRRLMMRGELDVNGAMQVIADRARKVADATGVAIAVLKRDQLVYQAGSGSATASIGRQVTATLSVSAKTKSEILRVENAETDKRIGAAICRQRGAKSLLILPIYQDRGMAGVLEVLFSEAHAFQECEVLTYQLMVRAVEDAISQASWLDPKKTM